MRAIPLVAPATTRTIGLVWLDRDPEPILARALLDVAAAASTSRRGLAQSPDDALGSRVDVHAAVADEAAQRDATVAGELHGERRGRPDCDDHGQPATAAFWTSSNESRPLTQRTGRASGRRPSRNARPITLSIALWRPTSSRAQTSSPAA